MVIAVEKVGDDTLLYRQNSTAREKNRAVRVHDCLVDRRIEFATNMPEQETRSNRWTGDSLFSTGFQHWAKYYRCLTLDFVRQMTQRASLPDCVDSSVNLSQMPNCR